MKKELNISIAILTISLFMMSHMAIAPAIPTLFHFYHAKDASIGLSSVENLVTISAMSILFVALFSDLFVQRFGKKKTVQTGLVMIILSGILSFFSQSFIVLVIARLLLGAGIGLYNPLTISLISDYFIGEKRATMIGFRTAALNLGKTIATFLVGYLLLINVSSIFLVYLLAVPVLLFFSQTIKEEGTEEVAKEQGETKTRFVLDKSVFLWFFLTFCVGVAYVGATLKVPTLLVTHYGYTELASSHMLTLMAFSGVVFGLFYGKLSTIFKGRTATLLFALMAVGNLLFGLGNHPILFYIGSILVGGSFVSGMSAIFDGISKQYPHKQINFVTSLAITAGNIGVALTPTLLTTLLDRLSLDGMILPFYILVVVMIIAIVFYEVSQKLGLTVAKKD